MEKNPGTFFQRLKKNRQTKIIFGLVIVGVIFLIGVVGYFLSQKNSKEIEKKYEGEGLTLAYRKLDGVLVSGSKADFFPVGVMIENLQSVRPQAGLKDASVIYEALTEGGITRFLAIYGTDTVPVIGPVRSARPYFVEFAAEYDLLFAHCGGSPQALTLIKETGLKNLNQIGGASQYYWREKDQKAPHNLYTKSELLVYALRDKELLNTKADFEPWKFKNDESFEARGESGKKITIDFSGKPYLVEYQYDKETNLYRRFTGGEPDLDKNSPDQLNAKNVIVEYVNQKTVDNEGRLEIELTGEGEAWLYFDGREVKGIWKKENAESRTRFFDEKSEEINLNRGQIWVEIVPKDKKVRYN